MSHQFTDSITQPAAPHESTPTARDRRLTDRRFAACLAAALLAMAAWLAHDQYQDLRAWDSIRAAHGCPERPTYQLDAGPNIPQQARGVWVCGDGTRWVR